MCLYSDLYQQPQLVWRGTDFGYLASLQPRNRLREPKRNKFIREVLYQEDDEGKDDENDHHKHNKRINVIVKMNEQYDTLLPRWKGVVLTANAEINAEGTDKLPWANIKFSSGTGKVVTVGSVKYAVWEKLGIATGESMSLLELANYKYHIDLGGGGGTTWTGTTTKLAMPGLLFHHVTPMKDYIHDHLTPWRHYIPISADLKDLKSKFDWAESHPVEAKRIADEGTKFMREIGTPQGFGTMFEQDFVEPVKQVIEAYQLIREDGLLWTDVLLSESNSAHFLPILECNGLGLKVKDDCQLMIGKEETGPKWREKEDEVSLET